jgi:hypothetical protein
VNNNWGGFVNKSEPVNIYIYIYIYIDREWLHVQGREMGKSISVVGVEDLVEAGLTTEEAHEFQRVLKEVVSGAKESDPREVWRQLVARRVLKPWHPHGLHQLVYHSVYAHWDASTNGPPPYWFPSLYDSCSSPSVYISSSFTVLSIVQRVNVLISTSIN